ncbi:hypothetical protein ACT4US_32085, partial [Bacillus sp. HC-Mk]
MDRVTDPIPLKELPKYFPVKFKVPTFLPYDITSDVKGEVRTLGKKNAVLTNEALICSSYSLCHQTPPLKTFYVILTHFDNTFCKQKRPLSFLRPSEKVTRIKRSLINTIVCEKLFRS